MPQCVSSNASAVFSLLIHQQDQTRKAGTGLSWTQWGQVNVPRATYISLYILPYLSLWEHLADNVFQRENIKLKRALGLLSPKLLILLIGSTELCPQSSTHFENEPATSLTPSLIN